VPPETEARNWADVTTFTDAVAGEIVMLIFVTGSVQVEVEDEVEVPLVVVHVMAVLGAAALWQEVSAARATSGTRNGRSFTAMLASRFEIAGASGFASFLSSIGSGQRHFV